MAFNARLGLTERVETFDLDNKYVVWSTSPGRRRCMPAIFTAEQYKLLSDLSADRSLLKETKGERFIGPILSISRNWYCPKEAIEGGRNKHILGS